MVVSGVLWRLHFWWMINSRMTHPCIIVKDFGDQKLALLDGSAIVRDDFSLTMRAAPARAILCRNDRAIP